MNAPIIPRLPCGKGWGMRGQALVPLLAACAVEKNAQGYIMPRVPCEPRRKATMLDGNGDGNLNLLLLDSTGDGVPDQPVASVGVDTTGDGRTDCLIADSNGDGRGNCLVIDTSGDGIPDIAFDVVLVDTDNDGQADVILVDTTGDGAADTFVHIYGHSRQHGRGGGSSAAQDSKMASSPIRHFGPKFAKVPNSPIEVDEHVDQAINYVTKIKKTFENYPGTYHAFLEILYKYKTEQKSINDIYEEVSRLFEDHPELLAEFSQFLPEFVPDGPPEEETMDLEADNGLGLTTALMGACAIDLNLPGLR